MGMVKPFRSCAANKKNDFLLPRETIHTVEPKIYLVIAEQN